MFECRIIFDSYQFVFYKFYKEGRHEMLNETNRAEVYRDVYDWLQRKIV